MRQLEKLKSSSILNFQFFYMVKGDMCLKIMEKGEPKDIHIKEGEVSQKNLHE